MAHRGSRCGGLALGGRPLWLEAGVSGRGSSAEEGQNEERCRTGECHEGYRLRLSRVYSRLRDDV